MELFELHSLERSSEALVCRHHHHQSAAAATAAAHELSSAAREREKAARTEARALELCVGRAGRFQVLAAISITIFDLIGPIFVAAPAKK